MSVDPTIAHEALMLRLSGAVDRSTAGDVMAALLDATARLTPPALVILDLRNLELLAGEGVRTLRQFADSGRVCGVHCRLLIEPGSIVARTLDFADPARQLPRYADLQQALTKPVISTAEPGERPSGAGVDGLIGQFESLTRTVLGATTVADALDHIVHATRLVIPGCDLVSVTLLDPANAFFTPAQTARFATELDQVQYRSGRGPCVDASRAEGPAYVASADLRIDHRWPEFAAAATGHGLRAIICTALLPGPGSAWLSGALTVYYRRAHGLIEADRHAALLLATHASLALAHARTAELAGLRQAQLHRAIDTRDIIGQAKGILMNRQGITAEEAFDLLSKASRQLNIRLLDLATDLATRHTELDVPPSATSEPE
ncbi:ANTAR domain-containing protein [Actinophytocola sp.]|uniref:ANTAR domain-containing protein n=1 Tax=Actinophytocola sp. TaxID=1872138 RepID=UPI002D7F2308|nr:ANTAR domain-containing protein [Actinophytocola sp.]HET9139249.1 ANTAR domain-containing protein [Actinophytocola sp.]